MSEFYRDWDDPEIDEWNYEEDSRQERLCLPLAAVVVAAAAVCYPRRYCYPRYDCSPRYYYYPRQYCYPVSFCYPRPCFPV